MEKIVDNVAAIMSFENMDLTDIDKNNIRCVLSGKKTGNEIIAEIMKDYTTTKGIV